MRSVRRHFPKSRRVIRLHGNFDKLPLWANFCGVAKIIPGQSVEMSPAKTYYDMSFSRFDVSRIPGDYLIYADADVVFSGRVDKLLEVPSGKIGLVSERKDGYMFRDQFVDELKLDKILDRYEVEKNYYSTNSGVIAGARESWNIIWKKLKSLLESDVELYQISRGNQGIVQIALEETGLWYELPRHCNEIKTSNWNGKKPTALHFTRGNTRPWRAGSSRRDNSYLAFREWRKYSRVLDFTLNNTFWKELFWRVLDDIRPMVRRFK